MTPLVSVIVPCFNARPWVEATLASLLAQTHRELQIIVVDDGSTDGSFECIQQVGASCIEVCRQKNRGASAARNEGLRRATGEFIQYLDADDVLSSDKIAAQVALLIHPAAAGKVASCRWGRFATDPGKASFVDDAVFRDFEPIDFLVHTTRTNSMMHPGAWLLPRAVAEAAGPWNESLSLNDDGEYFARAVLASRGVAFCGTGRSFYRSNLAGSLSRSRSRKAMVSLHRSAELTTDAMLAADSSPRVRQASADFWQHIGYELYPDAADLSRDALRRARDLGGSAVPPCGGSRQQTLARWIGWKLARRVARALGRW